jgi:hypothetical protein
VAEVHSRCDGALEDERHDDDRGGRRRHDYDTQDKDDDELKKICCKCTHSADLPMV